MSGPAESGGTPALTPLRYDQLSGWQDTDHSKALEAFQRSAAEILESGSGFRRSAVFAGERSDWLGLCEAALTAARARPFFEEHFLPFSVTDSGRPAGLFTGYFEPELQGSCVFSSDFAVPVYRKPDDLVGFTAAEEQETGLRYGRREGGKPLAYWTREEIECGQLAGRGLEICWVSDWTDAFFMHIQGNGRVRLREGGTIRLSYAAKSGHPYTGIGAVLADRGILTRATMSMQTVRAWMAAHPDEARRLMWQNKSFVFFHKTEITRDDLGAVGAAKVNLTPLHSMAIDRHFWMFGTPFWIETDFPPEARKNRDSIRRLMIGQDTGSAIKGAVRGDFYWGWGDDAALVAGHMKSAGRMTALLPRQAVARLGIAK